MAYHTSEHTGDFLVRRSFKKSNPTVPRSTVIIIVAVCLLVALVNVRAGIAGEPLSLPFPRLGMWWPDTGKESPADIGRYDWVIFGGWDRDRVPAIKAANPNLLALNSTNACELAFNPDPDAGPEENRDVLLIPPQWFLTQVGTVLASDVDATTTVLTVAEVAVSDGSDVYELFAPGDTALIDGESVYVESVDAASRTLKVRRGYVRPASAHGAGSRIAAHISFWPHSWVLNVSLFCPKAVVNPRIGAENWAEYNARAAARLLKDQIWNGILLDRSDPNESWLIGNSTARTIDPDQSNKLITDYGGFDASWNQGLRLYERRLRGAVGDDRIIFVNWGMANYDLLNGNNFEGFPNDAGTAYGTPWHATVMGPANNGSYFSWMRKARQPNLTMIETYEDDSGADPNGDGSYDNPCAHPGFTPNYRKMRFGLTTALLNDGFFSYEINTNGHGSLCLLWFDEYDNTGRGRGYLGAPLGPARHAVPPLSTPTLVRGGGMESAQALSLWDLWADTKHGYEATVSLDRQAPASGVASARVDVTRSRGVDWQVSFSYAPIKVRKGIEYTLSFRAKADRGHPISVWGQQSQSPWTTWLPFGSLVVTDGWKQFTVTAKARGSDDLAALHFCLGQTTGTIWIDDVRLQVGSRDVWRRDFAGGIALVNAAAAAKEISLGATFRKIKGAQAPDINDGSSVSQVTLPPRDGIILLRDEPQQRRF